MLLHECIQGTQRWLELRSGRPTSSEFDKIITPGGAPSKSASGYCNKLLVEVMLGRPLAGVEMPWMKRGKDMEAEAVRYYELLRDVDTVPIGFITTDDGRIGASPDRLVGDDGLLEIKCPSDETHSKYLAAHVDALLGAAGSGVYEAYKVQCQGQLFVAEREWSDVESYYPGLPEALTRVHRDDKFIALMKSALYGFIEMFDTRLDKLRSLGYLDEMAAKKAKGREPEPGAFGISEADINAYVESLKEKGVLTT